jgi:hypothetical protein
MKGEASTYAARKGLFHLFHIKDVTAQGRVFLLQVLRQGRRNGPNKKTQDPPLVTDEIPFRLEYTHRTNDENSTHVELIPGLTQVTIVLSEDDTPSNYSIDGVES